jgi:predicted RNA-binding Zn-ribbon protein involved in translation (DUF1610 family)
MYHCDACGWDGPEPAKHHEPIVTRDQTLLYTLRVCPACGEEVYETSILRPPEPRPQN